MIKFIFNLFNKCKRIKMDKFVQIPVESIDPENLIFEKDGSISLLKRTRAEIEKEKTTNEDAK